MVDTAEIVLRLRSQHTELAHRAADVIESLAASEAEARKMIDEALKAQAALLENLPEAERSLITAR
jgi:hypothetical protein